MQSQTYNPIARALHKKEAKSKVHNIASSTLESFWFFARLTKSERKMSIVKCNGARSISIDQAASRSIQRQSSKDSQHILFNGWRVTQSIALLTLNNSRKKFLPTMMRMLKVHLAPQVFYNISEPFQIFILYQLVTFPLIT